MTVKTFGSPNELGRCTWQSQGRVGRGELLAVDIIGPGRRHQIRAGLSHLEHPIHGDMLYGVPTDSRPLCLHAWAITLEGQRVVSPPPDWTR